MECGTELKFVCGSSVTVHCRQEGRSYSLPCRGAPPPYKPLKPALTAGVVVHAGLGKHSVVLNLRLAHGGAVVADDDQLGCGGGGAAQVREAGRYGAGYAGSGHSRAGQVSMAGFARGMGMGSAWAGGHHGTTPHSGAGQGQQRHACMHRKPCLTLARAQGLEAGLVAERVFARLHHQRQARIDVLL